MASLSVDYSSIVVNFNTIIQKLNAVAVDFAQKKNQNIKVENLAFSDAEDPKQAKFLGGGQYRIVAGMKDPDAELLPKKDFYDVLVEYTTWFCGKEDASYIKEDHLEPILKSTDLSSSHGEEQRDASSNGETGGTEHSDGNSEDSGSGVSESYYTKNENQFLEMLFEDNEPQNADVRSSENGENADGGSGSGNGNNDEQNGSEQKVIGYSISYDISVKGTKDKTVRDAIRQKSRGLFGGLLSDIRNISLTYNGHKINIGKWTDPAKLKELVGIIDIDKNRVRDNVQNAIDHDFSNNSTSVRVMANRGTNRGLETYLNRQGKLTPEIKAKLGKSEYSIVVSVNKEDVNYPDYNQKSMAKTVSKGLGTSDRLIDSNKVGEKDVIKIDDIDNLYKTKSSYDEIPKTDVRDRASDGKTPSVPSTSSTARSTQRQQVPTRSTVTEKENDGKGTEEQVKDETELERLVKSEEYKNFIQKELKNEFDTEFSNSEFKNDQNTCEFGSSEDISDKMMKLGVRDLDVLRKIKEGSKQSYLITIYKNLKNFLNEQVEIESNLLRILFEDSEDTENIIESDGKNTMDKVIDNAVDSLNITGDEKTDEKSKTKLKGELRKYLKNQRLGERLTIISERIIRNTLIKAIDKFDTGRDIDDMDTECYAESVIRQNSEEHETIKESIMRMVVERLNQMTEEKSSGTPMKIIKMNKELLGGIACIKKDRGESEDKGKLQVDPYCAVSTSQRIVDYMKTHNMGDESKYSQILKKQYCAIVIAKRDGKVGDKKIKGGAGNSNLTDSKVQREFDELVGTDNKMDMIKCENQKRETMSAIAGDLISRNLGYYKESNERSDTFIRNVEDRNIPTLDIWVRPFDIDDAPTPTDIPDNMDITTVWMFALPDPIPDVKKTGKDGTEKQSGDARKPNYQIDWYIIPHKRIKDLGDRPHQETHYQDGVTTTKTSDDQYKP